MQKGETEWGARVLYLDSDPVNGDLLASALLRSVCQPQCG